jgi:peptide/nickel transport system ATP-binding protein
MSVAEDTDRDDSGDVIFRVRDASVTFDMDRGESRVLDEVNLDVERQEILGVVGESGSGKSMFASALLDAVVRPGVLTGDITYYPDGEEPVELLSLSQSELKALRWEEVSMVFQGAMSSFNPTMEIAGHFRETLKEHDYDVDEGMDHARELLSELYLDPDRVLDSYPHELSGGMQQRALIALSLVLKPNVLVMDEPTAALDLLMQRSILSLIEHLQNRYDLTVVFITHDLPLVAGLADRLAVMYAFDFVEIGPADDIIGSASHPYTRALLKAVPNLRTPIGEMDPIEGSSPDPVNVPAGCSYHPRCPLADEQCRTEDPSYHQVDDDRVAACFHWDEAEDAVPLEMTATGEGESIEIEGKQSAEPVVSLNGVSVHFEEGGGFLGLLREGETVHAVDDVDLDVYGNDVVALVGESGCGKTTLGKTIIGVQRPTDGTVGYRGQDVWETKNSSFLEGDERDASFEEIRRSLQMIHQDPGSSLNPNRTVKATLAEPMIRWNPGLNAEDREARILGMLEHVGMTPAHDYAERYPHQLSGGEKQRVALIRALLMNPDVILADEAVSALDVSLRVEMMDLMLELQDQFDTSFVFISHNLSNARYFAGKVGGRIGVMYLGEIVEIGPAERIINDPRHPYTKVLRWSTADLAVEQTVEEPPIRGIDIPDPIDPPSGCRFHTRCPEAREVCTRESPEIEGDGSGGVHTAACFREHDEDHEYWTSEPLEGVDLDGEGAPTGVAAGDD